MKTISHKYNINQASLTLTYAGNMGLTHPLECLIEFLPDYITEYGVNSIQLLFVGGGAKKDSLLMLATSLICSSVIKFIPHLSNSEFISCMKLSFFQLLQLMILLHQRHCQVDL